MACTAPDMPCKMHDVWYNKKNKYNNVKKFLRSCNCPGLRSMFRYCSGVRRETTIEKGATVVTPFVHLSVFIGCSMYCHARLLRIYCHLCRRCSCEIVHL